MKNLTKMKMKNNNNYNFDQNPFKNNDLESKKLITVKQIKMKENILEFYKNNCNKQMTECKNLTELNEEQNGFNTFASEGNNFNYGEPSLSLHELKLHVIVDGSEELVFGISSKNEYSYKGFYKGEPIDYKKIFIFFNITNEIKNLTKFTYYISYNDIKVKGDYFFQSQITQNIVKPKIVTMGYHDNSIFGDLAIQRLLGFEYDLLIIPGNVALNIHHQNFKNMQNYFEKMEKNLTKAPLVIIPGGHEQIDNCKLFNAKFNPEASKLSRDLDVFHFYINDIVFYFVNLSKILLKRYLFPEIYKKYYNMLINTQKNENQHIKWRILISNEPLFCSGNSIQNEKCLKNILLLNPFFEISKTAGIEIFLAGGTSYYERIELPSVSKIKEIRQKELSKINKNKNHTQKNLLVSSFKSDERILEQVKNPEENEELTNEKNSTLYDKEMNASHENENNQEKENKIIIKKNYIKNYLNPLFKKERPANLINIGSAGYAKGYTRTRLNIDSHITKRKKTGIKGFVLLTFLQTDSRVFFIDFKDLEIQDFVLIGERSFRLDILE